MKPVLALVIIAAISLIAVGLMMQNVPDLFGIDSRETARNQTAISIAEIEANTLIAAQQIESNSDIEVTKIWARTLPGIVVLIIVGVLLGIVFWWQGKSRYYFYNGQPKRPMLDGTTFNTNQLESEEVYSVDWYYKKDDVVVHRNK